MRSAFLRSIRARLAILILLSMTALVGLLVYQEIQKHDDQKIRGDEDLLRTATFAAHAERERFAAAQRLLVLAEQAPVLQAVALAPEAQDKFDSCTRTLFVLDRLLPETTGFTLWDTSGITLCSSEAAHRGEFSAADKVWFQNARSRQGFATGAYELSPPDNAPSLGFGIPVKGPDGTSTVAYLSVGLALSGADELLAGTNLPRTGLLGIVDQSGTIINSTNGRSGAPAAGFIERFGALSGFLDSKVANGVDAATGDPNGRRVAAVRVTDASDSAVFVAIGADRDALVAPLARTLIDDLWPVAVLTALTLLALWLLGQRWVLRPVASLVSASEALARGELGARARVPSGVTEFERLADAFNEMAETRQQASQAKDEFLGLVSHELKTPITIVGGNAAILRSRGDRLDAEQRRAALEDIDDAARRLSTIIDNLLALARLERGAALEAEPVALLRLAQSAADEQLRQTPSRSVLVHGDGTVLALAGETYVSQVLQNLIANAVKYSPTGTPVEVTVARAGGQAHVRVQDRGKGVDESEREAVFIPFYRSDSTASFAEGLGIGLSVCKRLIETLGGSIWCVGRKDGGSEFGFTLPLSPDDALRTAEAPDAPAERTAATVDTQDATRRTPLPSQAQNLGS